jgi:hypothetical protein
MLLLITIFSIDVETSNLESPGLHAKMASFILINGLSDEKISPNQKYRESGLMARGVWKTEGGHQWGCRFLGGVKKR